MVHIKKRKQTSFLLRLVLRLAVKFRPQDTGRSLVPGGGRALAISSEVRASAHEDGLALLHIQTGRVFLCNRTGSRIWQSIAKGLSANDISEQISRECGVARDLVAQHTAAFLFELERRGLVYRKVEN